MSNQRSIQEYSDYPYKNLNTDNSRGDQGDLNASLNPPQQQQYTQKYPIHQVDPLNDQIQPQNFVKEYPNRLSSLQGDLYTRARSGFIMKVYSILSIQLAITVITCFISYSVQGILQFQMQNQWLFYAVDIAMLFVVLAIFCIRKHPFDLILLTIFTLGQSYIISYICSLVALSDGGQTVILAAFVTLLTVSGLTAYAAFVHFTNRQFKACYAILVLLVLSMLIFLIVAVVSSSQFAVKLYCLLGAFVMGIYIVIDTQMVMGKGETYSLDIDDYVVGALILYIDIIRLFLYILVLLKKSN